MKKQITQTKIEKAERLQLFVVRTGVRAGARRIGRRK